MATTVRNRLFDLLQQAEKQNNRKYSWAKIGREIGVTRQSAERIFLVEQSDDSYLRYGMIGRLLDFFNGEGLSVGITDLFTVVRRD